MPDLAPGDNWISGAAESFERVQTMFEKGLLAEKRILVTGGGSGLGAAMGRRFAELGAELMICGRRLDLLETTAAAIREEFASKALAIQCDIRDGAAVEAMMATIWREAPLDILVNNAAATFIARTEQLSFRAADAILSPTLHGTMYCTMAAGKRWIKAGHKGVVLSILSTSTITGRAFTVPSAMAKSAVLAMTKSSRGRVGPQGYSHRGDRAGRVSDPGRNGPASPRGARCKLGGAQPDGAHRRASRVGRSRKLPDFRCGRLHQR